MQGFKHSAPVGSSPLNFFGIADMAGNLWEWVHDYFGKKYYASVAKNNPKGPKKIEFFRVVVGMIQMWTIYQLLLYILKSQDTKIALLDLG